MSAIIVFIISIVLCWLQFLFFLDVIQLAKVHLRETALSILSSLSHVSLYLFYTKVQKKLVKYRSEDTTVQSQNKKMTKASNHLKMNAIFFFKTQKMIWLIVLI